MILQEVQIRVKRSFGDEAGAQITDEDIARWATDAQLDVVKTTKCNQTVTALNLVERVNEYTIPSSITISQVAVNGIALRSISSNELHQRFPDRAANGLTEGTPEYFTARSGPAGTVVTLYPWPDHASLDAYMQVTHNTRPPPVESPSDAFSIPEEYMDIVVAACLEKAYELDGQLMAAQSKSTQITNKMNEARADTREPLDDSYPAVRCLPGDLG